MRKAVAALVGVALVLGAAVISAPSAGARTTVEVNGDVVTITVPIDCAGCKGQTGPDGSPLADYWQNTANRVWNDAFARYPYCSRYLFKLNVKITPRGADFKGKNGDDLIQVAAPGAGALTGTGWEGATEETPGGLPGQRVPDGTRYYQNDADGAMAQNATPTVIAHEIGHTLGLGDDRDATGNALPGRDGTLMIGGARQSDGTLVTPNTPLRIDRALIDRIGKQLENLGKIKCKNITGTYHYHHDQLIADNGGHQIADATLPLSLSVNGTKLQGSIDGSVTAVLHLPICQSTNATPGHLSANLTGTLKKSGGAQELDLQVSDFSVTSPVMAPCAAGVPDPPFNAAYVMLATPDIEQAFGHIKSVGKDQFHAQSQSVIPVPGAPVTLTSDITARRG